MKHVFAFIYVAHFTFRLFFFFYTIVIEDIHAQNITTKQIFTVANNYINVLRLDVEGNTSLL